MLPRAILVLAVAACARPDAVTWGDARSLDGGITPGAVLAIGADGDPRIVALDPAPSATAGRTPCDLSVVVAVDGAGGAFAAWWEERHDRSVVLLVARRERDGGRAWALPVVADDRDRGQRGCERPPPAIAADGARGHVHLAYFLEPRDGPGIYAGHSMEDGAYFHGPIVIVYGDRPARTSVDVDGDLVVVAHEDPNGVRPRIAVAISETAGHLIEHRVPVPTSGAAAVPLVALDAGRLAVAWTAGDPATSGVRVRLGTLSDRLRRPVARRDE